MMSLVVPPQATENTTASALVQPVRCYFCRHPEHEHYVRIWDEACGTPGVFTYVRCRNCGLVFQKPRLSFDDIATRYPPDYITNGMRLNVPGRNWAGRLFEKAVLWGETRRAREIAAHHPIDSATRILDVGCGNATFLYAARKAYGADVTGVEMSDECCRCAHNRLGLDLIQSVFEEADLDGPFDIITMWHFLEHECDPLTALARCRLLLKEGGLLVIQVPNIESLGARVFGRSWNGWDAPRHLVMYSRKTLGAMLEKAGLTPVEMTSPTNCWGALLSLRLAFGLGLRIDLSQRFIWRLMQNIVLSPFDLVSHWWYGGEWITCYARPRDGQA
jgi:2-polyprenyl-3-methyl-5-hydroxy-6-metoxy-1,4-benzoquinol methylase